MKSLTAASNSQKKTGLGSPAGGAWELGNLGVDLVLFCPFFPDQFCFFFAKPNMNLCFGILCPMSDRVHDQVCQVFSLAFLVGRYEMIRLVI